MESNHQLILLQRLVLKQIIRLENLMSHLGEDPYVHDEIGEIVELLDRGVEESAFELSTSDHQFIQYLVWTNEMQ